MILINYVFLKLKMQKITTDINLAINAVEENWNSYSPVAIQDINGLIKLWVVVFMF